MKVLSFALFVILVTGCNFNSRSASAEITKKASEKFEGYVYLMFQAYADVDQSGNPINPLEQSDSSLLSTARRMYLYDNMLLDIMEEKHFVDGKYVGMDTLYYGFYDLNRQRFILFDSLAAEAKILNQGQMETDGSYSTAKAFDPLSTISDSSLWFTDTTIDDRQIVIARVHDTDSATYQYSRRTKFWTDPHVTNFPIQMSHSLSKRMNNSFVYKRQLPMPDGNAVLVAEFRYQPAKLQSDMIATFVRWRNRIDNP